MAILVLLLLVSSAYSFCNDYCEECVYGEYCAQCSSDSILLNGDCFACDDQDSDSCLSCENDEYFLNGFCLKQCPDGYVTTGKLCERVDGLTFDFMMNTLDGFAHDLSPHARKCQHGKSPEFYPSLDTYDPIPQENRGLYYNGEAYSIIYPHKHDNGYAAMSPYMTWQMWIRVVDFEDAVLFSHQGYQDFTILFVEEALAVESNGQWFETEDHYGYETWMCIGLTVEYFPENATTFFEFYLDEDIVETHQSNVQFKFDSPDVDTQTIGATVYDEDNAAPEDGFKGYIWQMTLFSYKLGYGQIKSFIIENNTYHCGVFPFSARGCLSECGFTQYGSECHECPAFCEFGCSQPGTCSLCADIDCQQCSSYAPDTCLECRAGKVAVEGVCRYFGASTEEMVKIVEEEDDEDDFQKCLSATGCLSIVVLCVIIICVALVAIVVACCCRKDKPGHDYGGRIPQQSFQEVAGDSEAREDPPMHPPQIQSDTGNRI